MDNSAGSTLVSVQVTHEQGKRPGNAVSWSAWAQLSLVVYPHMCWERCSSHQPYLDLVGGLSRQLQLLSPAGPAQHAHSQHQYRPAPAEKHAHQPAQTIFKHIHTQIQLRSVVMAAWSSSCTGLLWLQGVAALPEHAVPSVHQQSHVLLSTQQLLLDLLHHEVHLQRCLQGCSELRVLEALRLNGWQALEHLDSSAVGLQAPANTQVMGSVEYKTGRSRFNN